MSNHDRYGPRCLAGGFAGLVVFLALVMGLVLGVIAGCGGGGGGGGGSAPGPDPTPSSFQAPLPTNPTGWTGSSLLLTGGTSTAGFPNFAVGKTALTLITNLQNSTLSGVGVNFSLQPNPNLPAVVEPTRPGSAAPAAPKRLAFDLAAWQNAGLRNMAATEGIPQPITPEVWKKNLALAEGRSGVSASMAATVPATRQTAFYVYDFVNDQYLIRTAELKVTGTNCYIYLDQATSVPQATLQALADNFDTNIYSPVRNVFGSEWKPGIDNDNRIFILVTDAWDFTLSGGVGGYFYSADEYANTPGNPYSNQREIFYINPDFFNGFLEYAVLAHEFQHMINFNQRLRLHDVAEDTWLNEGLSRFAEDVAGYGIVANNQSDALQLQSYLEFPEETSLTLWESTGANYGCAGLFIMYLYDHFGGQAIISALMQGTQAGSANVTDATGRPFNNTFDEFAYANYFHGRVADPAYNYSSINIRGTYGGVTLRGAVPFTAPAPSSQSFTIKPYVARYYSTTNGDGSALQVGVSGATGSVGVFVIRN